MRRFGVSLRGAGSRCGKIKGMDSPLSLKLLSSLTFLLVSCSGADSAVRGPASEESPVAVDMESKASYDLASIHRVLRHKDMGGEALLGGFLAASAKDVLTADNLEQIINTKASHFWTTRES